jgi:hypothetical protein
MLLPLSKSIVTVSAILSNRFITSLLDTFLNLI